MPQRYCTNCGAELPEDARFCGRCGRPAHQTAAVATPEADVEVPPLPGHQSVPTEAQNVAPSTGGGVSSADSTRNALIALGVVVGVIVLLVVLGTAFGGEVAFGVLALMILPALAILLRIGGDSGNKDGAGRLVLRAGSEEPIDRAERMRLLEAEVSEYMRDGFFVRHRTETTAQLVKPKKFSFLWALLWFLLFGVGIVVYLIYYAAKRDEGRYVEVDEYGSVKARRQVHHVL